MKKLTLKVVLFLFTFAPFISSATLNPGDLAVIGMNCDGLLQTRTFSIVTLAPISAGEVINFTDRGISEGTFITQYTTEGVITITTTSNIAMGTVFMFTITGGLSPSVDCSPSMGTLSFSGWANTSTSPWIEPGDQILIYQAGPTFIFGFNNSSLNSGVSNGWNTGVSTDHLFSNIPPELTNGVNAIGFGGAEQEDNLYYSGIKNGDKATVLAAISNIDNWTSNNLFAYDLSPGGSSFPGENPIFFNSSVLPVHLVSFTGMLENNGLQFNWEVEGEENLSHYQIEGSNNGTMFNTIGNIEASGKKTYQFDFSSESTQQYFRLKMIDNDGMYRFSKVIMLFKEASDNSVIVYPNPVFAMINVSSKIKINRILITNMNGRAILSTLVNGSATSLNIQNLLPGIYQVHIYTEKGMIIKRVTKSH